MSISAGDHTPEWVWVNPGEAITPGSVEVTSLSKAKNGQPWGNKPWTRRPGRDYAPLLKYSRQSGDTSSRPLEVPKMGRVVQRWPKWSKWPKQVKVET